MVIAVLAPGTSGRPPQPTLRHRETGAATHNIAKLGSSVECRIAIGRYRTHRPQVDSVVYSWRVGSLVKALSFELG
jgi:hypothetical protein